MKECICGCTIIIIRGENKYCAHCFKEGMKISESWEEFKEFESVNEE